MEEVGILGAEHPQCAGASCAEMPLAGARLAAAGAVRSVALGGAATRSAACGHSSQHASMKPAPPVHMKASSTPLAARRFPSRRLATLPCRACAGRCAWRGAMSLCMRHTHSSRAGLRRACRPEAIRLSEPCSGSGVGSPGQFVHCPLEIIARTCRSREDKIILARRCADCGCGVQDCGDHGPSKPLMPFLREG